MSNMIKLTEKYGIKTGGEGATLIFSEPREKTVTNKSSGFKTKEPYIFVDEYHYQNVSQCLNKFLQLSLEDAQDVKGVLERILVTENIIKGLKL